MFLLPVNIELPANLFPQDIAAIILHAEVLVAEEAVQRDEGIDTFDNYALAVDTTGKVQYYGPKHEGMVRKMFRLEAFWKE